MNANIKQAHKYLKDLILCCVFAAACLLGELYLTVVLIPDLHLTILSVQVLLCIGISVLKLSQYLRIIINDNNTLSSMMLYLSIFIIIISILLAIFFLFYLKDVVL